MLESRRRPDNKTCLRQTFAQLLSYDHIDFERPCEKDASTSSQSSSSSDQNNSCYLRVVEVDRCQTAAPNPLRRCCCCSAEMASHGVMESLGFLGLPGILLWSNWGPPLPTRIPLPNLWNLVECKAILRDRNWNSKKDHRQKTHQLD